MIRPDFGNCAICRTFGRLYLDQRESEPGDNQIVQTAADGGERRSLRHDNTDR